MIKFHKPDLIPLIFIIAATLTLGGLGFWQLERLAWKNELIRQIEAAQAQPVLEALPKETATLDFRRVALSGRFIFDKTRHLVGKQEGMRAGYFMLTPFALAHDGRFILINRGFAPPGAESKPQGLQRIEGIVRPPRMKRLFSPSNHPEKNIWFYEDFAALSQTTGLALTPIVIEQTGKREKATFPIPSDGNINLRNDHLGYAITWFALALVGLVMFALYHRKKDL